MFQMIKKIKSCVFYFRTPKLNENSGVPIIGAYNIKDNQEIFIHDWREVHTDTTTTIPMVGFV